MTRIDVPTLQCDRCKITTQDTSEMMRFKKITYSHMSGHDDWDLCPNCWRYFIAFIGGRLLVPEEDTE